MTSTMRQTFLDNIKNYEEAIVALGKDNKENFKKKRDRVKMFFHIITCMRYTYGCPECGGKKKCNCIKITEKPFFVYWDEKLGIPILW